MGIFYGVVQVVRVVGSQLDDKPFYQTLQHPVELLTQDVAMALSNLAKGNIDDAIAKSIETTMKATGSPLSPFLIGKALTKRSLNKK